MFCCTTFGQISVEFNGVGGKPFGTFGENINRDAYFGFNLGLFSHVSKIKKNDMTKMSLSLGCNHSCHVRHKSKFI
jgi:hypothetical protein